MSLVDLTLLSGLEPDTKELEQVRKTLFYVTFYKAFRIFFFKNLSKNRRDMGKQILDG